MPLKPCKVLTNPEVDPLRERRVLGPLPSA